MSSSCCFEHIRRCLINSAVRDCRQIYPKIIYISLIEGEDNLPWPYQRHHELADSSDEDEDEAQEEIEDQYKYDPQATSTGSQVEMSDNEEIPEPVSLAAGGNGVCYTLYFSN